MFVACMNTIRAFQESLLKVSGKILDTFRNIILK